MLWGYIYSIIATTPIGGKKVANEENAKAGELRKYAHGLMKDYSPWEKEARPNPELFGEDEMKIFGVSNAVFTLSVRFILLIRVRSNFSLTLISPNPF